MKKANMQPSPRHNVNVNLFSVIPDLLNIHISIAGLVENVAKYKKLRANLFARLNHELASNFISSLPCLIAAGSTTTMEMLTAVLK